MFPEIKNSIVNKISKTIYENSKFKRNDRLNIAEFGSGHGFFTKVIRESFKDANIVGFNKKELKFPKAEKANALNYANQMEYGDVLETDYKRYKGYFDKIFIGSYMQFMLNHFFINLNDYYKIIDIFSSFLKPNGTFYHISLLNKFDNEAEKNRLELMKYILEISTLRSNNSSILDYYDMSLDFNDKIENRFREIGMNNIEIFYTKDEMFMDEEKENAMLHYSSLEVEDKAMKTKAIELDERISKYGLGSTNIAIMKVIN